MKPLYRASALLAGLAAFACGPAEDAIAPAPGPAEIPGDAATRVLGLRRLENRGPFLADNLERFQLDYLGLAPRGVTWSASGGEVVQRGLEVEWRLPKFRKAWLIAELDDGTRATFGFDVSDIDDKLLLVNPAAVGQIYMGTDGSSFCRLAIDTSDTPHVVFRTETHRQLWYAAFTGGSWAMRLIDGPGFDRGGLISDDFDIAVSPTGVPHIAYRYETNGEIRYASVSGANIIRERVSMTYNDNLARRVAIALDPANQNRPVIAWTYRTTSTFVEQPVVAHQTAANMWTERLWSTAPDGSYFNGGMVFDATGNAWLTYGNDPQYVKWSRAMGFFGQAAATTGIGSNDKAPIALDASNEPIIANGQDTFHRVGGNWVRTPFHNGSPSNLLDMVTFNGVPRLAIMHSNDLELLQTNGENFWLYTRADSASTPEVSMAVDTAGVSRVCYTKSGNVWFQ